MDLFRRNMELLEGERGRERLGMAGLPVLSRSWLVWSLAEVGRFAEGLTIGAEAVRIAEADNKAGSLIVAYVGSGLLYLRKGDLDKAIPALEQCLALCQVWNVPLWFPAIASHLGYAYALSGRVAEGLSPLEQAVERAAAMGIMAVHSRHVAWQSEAYLRAGRIEDALRLAQHAHDLSRSYEERGHEAYALRLLGDIVSHRDPSEAEMAESHYRQGLTLATELGMRPLVAHCHLGFGKLYRRTDDRAKAEEHLTTASRMYREMDMGFWLAQAEAEMRGLA